MAGESQTERPLSAPERGALAVSAALIIALCYVFSIVSIVMLLVLLAADAALLLGAARVGLARFITPHLKRHGLLLSMFVRSFWLPKPPEYRLLLRPAEAPRLFVVLAQLAKRFDVAEPNEVSIGMHSNAWVRLKGYGRGGTTLLTVGYDLLAGLSEGEVQAVLGHEMGHAKFVRRGMKRWLDLGVSRIATVTSQLSGLVDSRRVTGTPFKLAEVLLEASDALTRIAARLLARYSRQDEFEADRISAELFGAASMRSALVRLTALENKVRRLPWTERQAQLELEGSFSEWLTGELHCTAAELEQADREKVHDPYATHPSLHDRIGALPADDERQPSPKPGIQLLARPDRVAQNLIVEIHRVLAEQEQTDTKSLERWARKAQRSQHIRTAQTPGLILLIAGPLIGLGLLLDGSPLFAALACAAIIGPGVFAWRFGRYRDKVQLPVPGFAELKKNWASATDPDLEELEKKLEEELLQKTAPIEDKKQRVALLINEGTAALGHCEYLKAHVASRLAIDLNRKCAEARLIITVGAAGLRLWKQMETNLEAVRKETRWGTASTAWGAGWAFSIAGDWSRAEALLLRALEQQPNNTTFLMLLALAQSRRGKVHSAILNAEKAVALQPGKEHVKELVRNLLDAGRLREAEKRLVVLQSFAARDAELAFLIVRLRVQRRHFDAAADAADVLRSADDSPAWLLRLGEIFERARRDQHAARFYESALSRDHYPEALMGLARLDAEQGKTEDARGRLLLALDLSKKVGRGGRGVLDLFLPINGQLAMLEPVMNCEAWVATFPSHAKPPALAARSLTLFAKNQIAASKYLDMVISAMQPEDPRTPAQSLRWHEAPKHQQPARPVRPGVQYVQ